MERQLLTQEMENEGQAGMTYRSSYARSRYKAEAVYDSRLNRLQVSTDVGGFVYTSEWLDVSPQLGQSDMDQHIPEVLARWQVRAGLLAGKDMNGLRPLEYNPLLISMLEHVLA